MSDAIAIHTGEHYYKLSADGRLLTEQAEADLTFSDISLMSQLLALTLPGQGYPSADAAMRAGICVRDLSAQTLHADDVFDVEETIRLRHALRNCPLHQREAAMDRMRDWRIHDIILQTILDGMTQIQGVDEVGDPVIGLAQKMKTAV